MFKYLIVFLFLSLTTQALPIKASKAIPIEARQLKSDSSKVLLRSFDQQKIKAYSKQADFRYDQPIDTSLWDRFWAWLWKWVGNVSINKYTGSMMKYVVIFAVIALLIFMVIKITGMDLKIFTGKSKTIDIPYAESADNIHEIDFNTEIEKAIANVNYRLAVRLMYLRSLKRLNNKNLINWQPEKTNQTYIKEIADPHKRQQFSLLTTQFEYIWYGEFFIDKENFSQVKNSYDQFNIDIL